MTPLGPGLFECLRRDAARYRQMGGWWRSLGFWLVASYRLNAWARGVRVPGARSLFMVAAWAVRRPLGVLLHVELPSVATIGPGFFLPHPYGVLIGAEAVIGEECTVFHDVTVGTGADGRCPRLEPHVVLFAGCRVVGGVTVGERTEIGPNCVVSRSVPPHSVVVAALPRVVPQRLVRGVGVAPPSTGDPDRA